jgi:hypothetical protein
MTRFPPNRRFAACLALAIAALGTGGCRERNISAYRIPKEADALEAAPAPEEPAEAPQMRFMAPAGWQTQPASGMREASFLIAGPGGSTADVSVVSFPGSGGDDLANINRWRGQLKLPPVGAAELAGQTTALVAAAGEFVVADMAGTGDKGEARILGAWLRRADRVWFFKVMGPSELVEGQKEAFTAFLKSVSLGAGPAALAQQGPGPANTNDLPRTPPATMTQPPPPGQAPMASVPVQASRGASLQWTAPADWQSKPGSAMRKGSYSAAGAEVAITAFPGDVGGMLANVNRWRGQAGLDPVDEAALPSVTSSFDSNGLHFVVLDASDGPQPLVAAAVPWGGGTWFFKLTGPTAAVAKAKPAFLSFLRTVRAPQ